VEERRTEETGAEELERWPEEVGAEELQGRDALGAVELRAGRARARDLGTKELHHAPPPGARRSSSSNRRHHATGTLDPLGWS
jgi:hypothetical protein